MSYVLYLYWNLQPDARYVQKIIKLSEVFEVVDYLLKDDGRLVLQKSSTTDIGADK